MNQEELLQGLVNCRKQELHGYAAIGKDFHDTFGPYCATADDVYDVLLEKGVKPPFSKTTCIAMHRLYIGHPEWADDVDNVVINDLTEDERDLLESVAIERMHQFCEANGMDPSFLYESSPD